MNNEVRTQISLEKVQKTVPKHKPSHFSKKKKAGAVLLVDDEFERVKEECWEAVQEIIDEGEPFEDEEFDFINDTRFCIYGKKPQRDFSMKSFKRDNYEVMRLTEHLEDVGELHVFLDGATSDDIVQGFNGTCWFLGALMAVAERENFLHELVVNYSIELGVYGIMFFVNGGWSYVIIDDYVPVNLDEGCLYNSTSKDANELWVTLFEKAYSKVRKHYHSKPKVLNWL